MADAMDNSADPSSICLTNTSFFMSKTAEFMYVITVILRCDIALLWRINFPLKLLSALALILSLKGNALFYVRITKNRLILPYIKER